MAKMRGSVFMRAMMPRAVRKPSIGKSGRGDRRRQCEGAPATPPWPPIPPREVANLAYFASLAIFARKNTATFPTCVTSALAVFSAICGARSCF